MNAIVTPRLLLRQCRQSDRDLFFEVSSDPRVLEFFPFHRSRRDADAVFDLVLEAQSRDDLGFYVMALQDGGEPVGFCGLSRPQLAPILPQDAVEIGWRLSARHWRKGYATEAGEALLQRGFENLGLQEILSLTVHDNHRAAAVMTRLGMRRDAAGDFNHPQIPETHPQLRRHILFRLGAEEWRAGRRG